MSNYPCPEKCIPFGDVGHTMDVKCLECHTKVLTIQTELELRHQSCITPWRTAAPDVVSCEKCARAIGFVVKVTVPELR